MTAKEIQRALTFWRPILRLEDWAIDVVQGKSKDLIQDNGDGEEEHDALTYIYPEELGAKLILRRGATEETFVHELLHLVVDGDKGYKNYDALHERAINRVASALMLLKTKAEEGK